jgi:DNA helicase-2/ATP-dependent DNA helicase PcrA
MRKPTDEQQAVLNNKARVRIVRAAPGSGKTWLVAELIRQELDNWPTRTSGIAALSFTRVGGDEIRKAVGHELGHPHFVGTIDAFLFRYVVRPFLKKCYQHLAAPRLIPGEWGAEHWSKYGRNLKATVGDDRKPISLSGCVFIDEDQDGKAIVACKRYHAKPLARLLGDELKSVKDAKMKLWERLGWLTHSDAALWASKILEHETFGPDVRAEVVRRFPLIIVDELQDTGYFLGKSICLLVKEPSVRSVLVGDPDQAIFEFNGARPDLFNRFESINDTITLPLSGSRRCASSIAIVAAHLKDSRGSIGPAPGSTGRAFLVRYDDMVADIFRLVDIVTKGQNEASTKVIARHTATVDALIGRSTKTAPKLGCPPLNHMQRAVVAFRQGRQVAALAAARATLESAVFQHEGVDDTELEEHSIEPSQWKRLSVDCLLSASTVPAAGNLYDWHNEVGKIIFEKLDEFGLDPSFQFTTDRLKPQKRKDWDKACADYLPQISASAPVKTDVPVVTVHGVKGETHDVTIFVCPDTKKANYCPSAVWWSADEKDREEKRIAYVAMTRTQGDLIVCVSNNCFQRLCTNRKAFVDNFECMTVDEFAQERGA